MFAYACIIKILALGFNKLESIFGLLLVPEAFSLQKVVLVWRSLKKQQLIGKRSGEYGE